MRKRVGAAVVGETIRELVDYTKTHFSMEEDLFRRYHYQEPEHGLHLEAHISFVKTLEDFQREFNGGKESVGIKMLNFLRRWLIEHIKGTDTKYVPFFKRHGIQ